MVYVIFTIISFFVISVGGFAVAVFTDRSFEEAIPVGNTVIMALMFIITLVCGRLSVSFCIILIICLGLYAGILIKVNGRKNTADAGKRIFTTGFYIYLVNFSIILISTFGMRINANDDFSHWADIVKLMCIYDDFGTNPSCNAFYASYPPGMALFQSFFVKLNLLINGTDFFLSAFDEWILFFAHRIFVISFTLPLYKKLEKQALLFALLFNLLLIIAPTAIESWVYLTVMVDAAMGILFGLGAAVIFTNREKNDAYDAYIFSIILSECLLKESGFFFAVILCIMYIVVEVLNGERFKTSYLFAAAACAVPKILWKLHCNSRGIEKIYGSSYDIKGFFNVLSGKDSTYRNIVFKDFLNKMISTGITIGSTVIPYLLIFAGFTVFVVLSAVYFGKKRHNKKTAAVTAVLFIFSAFLYVLGQLYLYLFMFTEEQAIILTSFERYLNTLMYAFMFFSSVTVFSVISEAPQKPVSIFSVICFAALLLAVPKISGVYNSLTRKDVESTNEVAEEYLLVAERIKKDIGETNAVVSIQDSFELSEYYRIRFYLRPYITCYGDLDGADYTLGN